MNKVFENPGLCHIGEKILQKMDFQSILSCRLVRKSWRNLLEKGISETKSSDLQKLFAAKAEMVKNTPFYDKWLYFLPEITKESNPLINHYLQKVLNNESIYFHRIGPLQAFISVENLKMVEFLLNNNLIPQLLLKSECFFGFDFAAMNGQMKVLKLFKKYNIHSMISPIQYARDTLRKPVLHATMSGQIEVLKFLLEDWINCKFDYYVNQLKISNVAAEHGQLEIMKYLCQKMHNPILTDEMGNSTIHVAASNGHFEIVKLLTNFTFHPDLPNDEGIKPSSVAKSKGFGNIEMFLLQSAEQRRLEMNQKICF